MFPPLRNRREKRKVFPKKPVRKFEKSRFVKYSYNRFHNHQRAFYLEHNDFQFRNPDRHHRDPGCLLHPYADPDHDPAKQTGGLLSQTRRNYAVYGYFRPEYPDNRRNRKLDEYDGPLCRRPGRGAVGLRLFPGRRVSARRGGVRRISPAEQPQGWRLCADQVEICA